MSLHLVGVGLGILVGDGLVKPQRRRRKKKRRNRNFGNSPVQTERAKTDRVWPLRTGTHPAESSSTGNDFETEGMPSISDHERLFQETTDWLEEISRPDVKRASGHQGEPRVAAKVEPTPEPVLRRAPQDGDDKGQSVLRDAPADRHGQPRGSHRRTTRQRRTVAKDWAVWRKLPLPLAVAGLVFLAGFLSWLSHPAGLDRTERLWTPAVTASSADVAARVAARPARLVPIEALRVGDRVLADNPEDGRPAASEPTDVNPATWRKLVLRADLLWPDGTVDDIHVETLQPPQWIADHDARVGSLVPLPLDLVEIGLRKGLKARVLENLPCPPIRPGPGRVVLTTVNHLNRYVFELRLEDEQGRQTTVRPTGFHKFFSADRGEWISADSIREGERLTALGGTVRLLSRTRLPGTHRVYNLTVEGEHVYHVTNLVVDGHNTCDENKLHHIFDNPNHDLSDVVDAVGSKESAYKQMLESVQELADAGKITGQYETTITIAGKTVTVRGKVIDGTARIGTAFK